MNYYFLPALFILFFSVYAFSVILSVAYVLPGNISILLFAFLFAFLSAIYRLKLYYRRVIVVNAGFFIFIILIFYIIFSLICVEDFSRFNYPIGMLYFFTLGILLSFSSNDLVSYINISSSGAQFYNRILILLLLIFSFLSAYVFFQILGVTGTVFRLYSADIIGSYQNSGYYASILFLIINYMMLNYVILIANKVKRYHAYSVSILYTLTFFFLLLTSILMGSNYAVVSLITMLLIFLFVYRLSVTKRDYLSQNKYTFKRFYSIDIIGNLFWYFFKIFIPTALIVTLIYFNLGAELSSGALDGVRIFDTSEEGAINSLMSRIEILKNFETQFSVSPFFGNMYADNLTTGSGTAAHSLVLSLLTHTGVIGFLLFCVFFISIFSSMMKLNFDSEIHTNLVKLFAFYNIIFVFVFSNISNVFYAPIIWFTFGFLGFFIKVRNPRSFHKLDWDKADNPNIKG